MIMFFIIAFPIIVMIIFNVLAAIEYLKRRGTATKDAYFYSVMNSLFAGFGWLVTLAMWVHNQ